MSLRTKFFISFLFVSTLPLIAIGVSTFLQSQHEMQDRAVTKLEAVADVQTKRIHEVLNNRLNIVRTLASLDVLHTSLHTYNTTDGAEGREAIRSVVTNLKNAIPEIESIEVYDTELWPVVSSNAKQGLEEHALELHGSEGKTYELNEIYKDDSNQMRVRFLGPIFNQSERIGVVEVVFTADSFLAVTEDYTGLGSTGEVQLVKRTPSDDALFITPSRLDSEAAFARVVPKERTSTPAIHAINGEETALTDPDTFDHRGIPVVAVTRHIHPLDWGVIVKMDRAEVFAPMTALKQAYFIIGGIALVLMLLVSFLLASSVSRPIHALADSASALEKGDFSVRARLVGGGEVGVLTRAFNSMAARLEALYHELEQKVAERTNTLNQKMSELETNTHKLSSAVAGLERSLDKEKLIKEIAQKLAEEGPAEEIVQSVLTQIGTYTHVSRVYIFENSPDNLMCSNTFEWCAVGVIPQKDNLQNIPYSMIPSFSPLLDAGMIHSEHIEELPLDVYEILKPQNILSIIILPIIMRGTRIGYMGFDECVTNRTWDESEITLLQTVSDMLSGYYQRKRSERVIADGRMRLENIITGTNVGTWEWNVTSGETVFSERWAEIVGYTLDELSPTSIETWKSLVCEKDRQKSQDLLNEHLQGKTDRYVCELRMCHKDGHLVWVLDQGRVYKRDAQGAPLMMSGTHLDMTALKRQEMELQSLASELQEAQRLGQFGSGTWDLSKDRIVWSEELFRIHGLQPTPDHSLASIDVFMQTIEEHDVPMLKEALRRARSQSETSFTYRVRWPDGSIHYIHATTKLTRKKNRTAGILKGVFQDVTHEREVDRAKTEFVSLASHQLRTPLTAIMWYAEMLLAGDAGKLTKKQDGFMREIYNGNKRMIDLVNALLNVSRLELGTFVVHPTPTSIRSLVKQVLHDLAPQVHEKKLTLRETYARALPEVPVDQELYKMIVQNLVSNAVKYTPQGGRITISSVVEHNELVLSVKDTGYGIPVEAQGKMFTKFYRADNILDKETNGSGLGLYMVRAILNQVGGRVWFESELDKGTTFHVSIPVRGMLTKSQASMLE
jgi:PAS domain S-box-containing protein